MTQEMEIQEENVEACVYINKGENGDSKLRRILTSPWCAITDCTGLVGAGDRKSQIKRC